ncbi:4Fe-4S cluster-binding domain-containing protein [uncultured Methanobrevibacter sp.]|uniref:4Fe-4S cluster-binding domain-containing protein n=1 Tax=uncultured Methanobrevibacter sp. TaxID=253161 RepID=UPI0025F2F383|nr:4Fe-4S cluster-binding domain-containing protein [uncultured Methanobrevibacter sp.]
MCVRITDIQHFSLHDGQGIRTTVFLKGCPLNCPWCSNPECISFDIDDNFGRDISLDDLEYEILKDQHYYKTGGGVTFSGGEPLLQIKQLEPLLKSLSSKKINICFETSLFVPKNLLNISTKYADEFIVDIKILTPDNSKTILGGDVTVYLNNLKLLDMDKTTFRIPVSDFILEESNVNLILELLNKYKPKNVEIFKIHDLAKKKYLILKKEQYFNEVSNESLNEFYSKINKLCNCEIIEI